MKRTISVIMSLVVALSALLFGCESAVDNEKTTVVASIYPIFDWVNELTSGTGIDVKLLVNGGSDVHSYQPSVADVAAISRADLFVYVGGESDAWVESALKNTAGGRTDLSLLGTGSLTTFEEEITEGMQSEEHDDHDDHDGHDGHDDHGAETDEHIWLSLKAAAACVKIIEEKLCAISPENSEKIAENAEKYVSKLLSLYENQLKEAEKHRGKTMIFADRFPFRYLAEEFGFEYYAPFPGCSAETEASFETVAVLSGKVEELRAGKVFVLKGNDGKLAKTIAPTAGVLTLDSLETRGESSYLETMSENFQTILKGLY